MTRIGKSDKEMAAALNKHRSLIGRYRRHQTIPPAKVISDIQQITGGKVRFHDWFQKPGT